MFYVNGNYKVGVPFKNLYSNPKLWYIGIDDMKKGLKFEAAESKVYKGFFGDKVVNSTLTNLNANMFLSTVEEVSNKLIEINNNLKLFYEENYEDMKQNYIDLITQLDELVNIFDLPFKYRNINDIYLLIEYVKNGRVDNWKEAINLLEVEKHQEKLLLKFDDLNLTISNLSNIIEKELDYSNLQLSNISNKLTSLNIKMQQSVFALTKIMRDTRLNLILK